MIDHAALAALRELQHTLGNLGTVNNAVIELSDRTDRLTHHLKPALQAARDAINAALLLLPAVLVAVLLAGCSGVVQDFKNLEAFAKSPTVSYANPDAWSCDVLKAPNTKGQVEDCSVCVNRASHSEAVTINKTVSSVPPGGSTLRCSDSARVRDATLTPAVERRR
jgi:hypothetical protein